MRFRPWLPVVRGLLLVAGLTSLLSCGWAAPSLGADDARPAAESTTASPDTWHATTFVSGAMGFRVIRYWSKGQWMRAQTLIGGHPIVTIVRDGHYIGYDELAGTGVRIERAPQAIAEDRARPRPFGNDLDELKRQGADKVEETTRAGVEVEIWRKTDAAGRRKLWVTKSEPQLPMRLETFVRAGGDTITTEYSGWSKGLPIPDSFFEAPANVKLERLDYAAFLDAAAAGPVGPVLYPDLLHGAEVD